MSFKINNNSIVILNHKITIDDMINEIYYMFNNSHYNDPKIADNIICSNLNQDDKDKFNNFREQKLHDAIINSDIIKPFFKNNTVKYQSYNNKLYCLSVKSILDDYYNNINCINDFIIYINIFYKVLKFKIKQERITKNISNDLHLTNRKLMELENKFYEFRNILRSHEKQIDKICNQIDYIYNTYDKNKNIINYNYIYNEFNIIKNMQKYIIIFLFIVLSLNIYIIINKKLIF